jgi:hypothetical protein
MFSIWYCCQHSIYPYHVIYGAIYEVNPQLNISFNFSLFFCCETVIQSEKEVCRAPLSGYATPPWSPGLFGCLFVCHHHWWHVYKCYFLISILDNFLNPHVHSLVPIYWSDSALGFGKSPPVKPKLYNPCTGHCRWFTQCDLRETTRPFDSHRWWSLNINAGWYFSICCPFFRSSFSRCWWWAFLTAHCVFLLILCPMHRAITEEVKNVTYPVHYYS